MDWITGSSHPFLYNHSIEVVKAFVNFINRFTALLLKQVRVLVC